MAKREMQYFDARRQAEDSTWSRSANLMCYLLRGIDYQELYGNVIDPGMTGIHLFHKLLANASRLPDDLQVDADGEDYDVRYVLSDSRTGTLAMIVAAIDAYNGTHTPDIKLGDLFWVPRNNSMTLTDLEAIRNLIVDTLDTMTDRHTRMRHFCAPFVGVQLGRAPLLTDYHVRDFLFHLGNKNIQDFYTTRGSKDERMAVDRAKAAGMLSERYPPAPLSMMLDEVAVRPLTRDGNGMICSGNGCIPSGDPDTWCVEVVVNGVRQCALGSDHV